MWHHCSGEPYTFIVLGFVSHSIGSFADQTHINNTFESTVEQRTNQENKQQLLGAHMFRSWPLKTKNAQTNTQWFWNLRKAQNCNRCNATCLLNVKSRRSDSFRCVEGLFIECDCWCFVVPFFSHGMSTFVDAVGLKQNIRSWCSIVFTTIVILNLDIVCVVVYTKLTKTFENVKQNRRLVRHTVDSWPQKQRIYTTTSVFLLTIQHKNNGIINNSTRHFVNNGFEIVTVQQN